MACPDFFPEGRNLLRREMQIEAAVQKLFISRGVIDNLLSDALGSRRAQHRAAQTDDPLWNEAKANRRAHETRIGQGLQFVAARCEMSHRARLKRKDEAGLINIFKIP